MADLGRIPGSVSVLLRSVLKIIGTDELNLRWFNLKVSKSTMAAIYSGQ
jgi:hypothetical protein